MKIQDILKKQGKLYGNLIVKKPLQKHSKPIKKSQKLVPYGPHGCRMLLEQEYKAITELENLVWMKPVLLFDLRYCSNTNDFEIFVRDNRIIFLKIQKKDLTYLPKQINDLQNLQELHLPDNKITEIENISELKNLEVLNLNWNRIQEIKNIDKLQNIQKLYLSNSQIYKIKNLDKLNNLQELHLNSNQIAKIENLDNLTKLTRLNLGCNCIEEMENFPKNLKELYLNNNEIKKIKNLPEKLKYLNIERNFWMVSCFERRAEINSLREKGIEVTI